MTQDLAALVPLLSDPSVMQIEHVLQTFADSGKKIAPYLDRILPLLRHESAEIRWMAIRAVAASQDSGLSHLLLPLLDDPNAEVRAEALDILGALRATQYEQKYLRMLDDPSAWVRMKGARLAGFLALASLIPKLRALLGDPDPDVRASATFALSQLDPEGSTEGLRDFLYSEFPWIRERAAFALARRSDSRLAPEFLRLLADPDRIVQSKAVLGLMLIDREAYLPTVMAMIEEANDGPHPELLAVLKAGKPRPFPSGIQPRPKNS